MKFFIVTPSYNQLDWIKLCIASVADQATDGMAHGAERIEVCHHIQDAQSTDGTREWLAEYVSRQPATNDYQLTYTSEADEGMYDAINRGWRRAMDDVDVIAHLNCDEQYLPGALETIARFMKAHSRADVVLADMIVVDRDGEYICHRRSLKPHALVTRYCCGGFTATTFQRASVTREKKVFFDTGWRNFGDKVWYNALHKTGCRFAICNHPVAIFTDTGANLNWTDEGRGEKRRYEVEFLRGSGRGTVLLSKVNALRRSIKELLLKPPRSYELYRTVDGVRERMCIARPTGHWHKKWEITRN